MPNSTLIAVAHKPGVMDPAGRGLQNDIEELGLASVKAVRSAQLYRLEGDVSAEDRRRIEKDLLCDPIIQECEERPSPQPLTPRERAAKGLGEGHRPGIVIDVWYKPGVTDVVGDSVHKGIRDLAIECVKRVRTGMRYTFEGVTKRGMAEKIALALLVNPLVHDCTISAAGGSVLKEGRAC